MINKARFRNFKLLRDVEIELGQLSVIVGANGTGKSSMLEGLASIMAVAGKAPDEEQPRMLAPRHFVDERAPELLRSVGTTEGFSLEILTDTGTRYRVKHHPRSRHLRDAFEHELEQSDKEVPLHFGPSDAPAVSRGAPNELGFFNRLAKCGLQSFAQLRLDARSIERAHHSSDADLKLTGEGEGLPWILQRILTSRDGTFERLEAAIAEVLPEFKRMRTRQQTIQIEDSLPIRIGETDHLVPQSREVIGARLEVEWGKVGWIRAEQLSEGTLLVISLLTALHDSPPKIILIDDLDRGLHPSAQVALVTALKKVLAAQPTLQVLATTHSPYVVDAIDAERVLVASCPDGNAARIRRLSDNPDWVSRKAYFSPGEFWSAVGEGWVGERTT